MSYQALFSLKSSWCLLQSKRNHLSIKTRNTFTVVSLYINIMIPKNTRVESIFEIFLSFFIFFRNIVSINRAGTSKKTMKSEGSEIESQSYPQAGFYKKNYKRKNTFPES